MVRWRDSRLTVAFHTSGCRINTFDSTSRTAAASADGQDRHRAIVRLNARCALGEPPRDVVYEPYTQAKSLPAVSFVIRTTRDPGRLALALVEAGRKAVPNLRVTQWTTMAEHLAISRLPSQVGAVLLAVFAVTGMALAAVGVYGMVRHSVARRSREVGTRMALGADPAGVARLLANSGLRLVLLGGAIGGIASLLAARFLSTLVLGVGSFDPVTLIGAPLVLGSVAWLASYLPARRASRSDPLDALRAD